MADIGFKLFGDNSSFRAMIDSSQNAITKFGGVLSAFGVGISLGGVVAFFKTVAEKVGALQDLSDNLGVSTDALQSFEFAVTQAGGKSAQATKVWENAKKAFDELAAGTPAVVKQFEAIGITQKTMLGLNTEQKLQVMAQAFKQNEKEAGVYSTVCELLGTKVLPKLNTVLLRLGVEGWAGFNKGARDAGQLIGGDTIGRIDALGDRLAAYQGQLTKVAAVTLDVVTVMLQWQTVLIALGKKAVPDSVVKIATVLGTLPKFLGMAAESATGLDLPFIGMEAKAKSAAAAIVTILPPIQHITEEGKKQLLQRYDDLRIDEAKSSHSKQVVGLKNDLAAIETKLAAGNLSQLETDKLRALHVHATKLLKGEQGEFDKEAKKHAEAMEEFTAKEIEDKRALLTTAEQMKALRDDEAGWIAVMGDKGAEQEVRDRAAEELAKTRAKMRDVEKERVKEIAELEEGRVAANTRLTKSDIERLSVKELESEQLIIAQETSRLQGIAAKDLTTADVERLNVLNQQNDVIAKQLEQTKIISSVTRKGNSYDQQTDTSLEGVRDRLNQQIQQIQRDDFSRRGGVGGKGKSAELYLLETEFFNLQKEMDERQEVRDYAGRFGEQRARQQFGDTLTDKALRDWTDQQSRTTSAVEDIQMRLAALFPKK